MQVNVAGLRRNIKNLAHNYSDAQVKVREATSNDPWGPSAAIMAEIADLTNNIVAFSEIMQMIWKRLNDHGKNWRHVYKALILLEYLIKTGSEKVAQQCKENIFAIQTLREFVYYEENKDQGTHVREKAKQLVNLLKDDERLKNERIKALKAKERFAQHPSGFGSDGYIDGPPLRDMPPGWQEEQKAMSELELVRPQTAGEEELQLKLAMAMSREEAEQEEAKRRSDDVRLQLALSQSEQDFKDQHTVRHVKKEEPQSHLLDLLDISLGAASISSPPLGAAGGIGASGADPWVTPARAASQLSDPWSGTSSPQIDPWHPTAANMRSHTASVPLNSGAVNTSTNGDAWALRTQSPSIASGSSTEGWLQSNGSTLNGNNSNVASTLAASTALDPWLGKSTISTLAAGQSSSLNTTTAASGGNTIIDPWLNETSKHAQPINVAAAAATIENDDPWAPKTMASLDDPWKCLEITGNKKISPDLDEFDIISNRNKTGDLISNDLLSGPTNNNNAMETTITTNGKKPLKTPHAFLGENSSLVNLDNLIKPVVPQSQSGSAAYNPFSDTVIPPKTNLFQQQQPTVPSINQLKQQQPFAMSMNQDPWAPVSNPNAVSQQVKENPFLLKSDELISRTRSNANSTTIATDQNNAYYAPQYNIHGNQLNCISDSYDDIFSTAQFVPYRLLNPQYINDSNNNNYSDNNANQQPYSNHNNNDNININNNNNNTSNGECNSHLKFSLSNSGIIYDRLMPNSSRNIGNNANNNNNGDNNNEDNQQSHLYPSLQNFSNYDIQRNEAISARQSRSMNSVESGTSQSHGGSLFSYGFYDANVVVPNEFQMQDNKNSNDYTNSSNNNNDMGWLKPDAASSNPFLS